MNAEERDILIERVEEQIAEVTSSIADYKELTKPVAPDDAIGRVSRMDAINNRSVNEAALRKAEVRLRGLQRILQEKDATDLGICKGCRQEIPMARLLLVPQSSKCVRCASR